MKMRLVIRNREAVGFLVSCAKGWKGYDHDGRPLGYFDTEELAAKAVYEQAEADSQRNSNMAIAPDEKEQG